jgi:hypothetical protein
MTRVLSVLVALVLVAVTSSTAIAQAAQTNAPAGNSAIDEYLETVPGATGDQRSPPAGSGHSSVLTAAQRARLDRLGPDGKTLAAAVEATAPPSSRAKPSGQALSAQGRSPLGEVLDAATGQDGSGMGLVLPLILLSSLLGTLALVVLRRRATP